MKRFGGRTISTLAAAITLVGCSDTHKHVVDDQTFYHTPSAGIVAFVDTTRTASGGAHPYIVDTNMDGDADVWRAYSVILRGGSIMQAPLSEESKKYANAILAQFYDSQPSDIH